MNTIKTWTEADERIMCRMIEKGHSNKEIAQVLGREQSYISHKKLEFGYSKSIRHWNQESINKLIQGYEEGLTDKELAELTKHSRSSISQKRLMMGLNRVNVVDRLNWNKCYNRTYFINQLRRCDTLEQAINLTQLSSFTINKKLDLCVQKEDISKYEADKIKRCLYEKRKVIRIS